MTIISMPTIHGLTTGWCRCSEVARYWKNLNIVKPNAISDVLVRIHAISVRSLAIRVRCTASRVDVSICSATGALESVVEFAAVAGTRAARRDGFGAAPREHGKGVVHLGGQ